MVKPGRCVPKHCSPLLWDLLRVSEREGENETEIERQIYILYINSVVVVNMSVESKLVIKIHSPLVDTPTTACVRSYSTGG